MPVFCLTPIDCTANNDRWQNSTIRPKCVWVFADNEVDARRQVQLATTAERAPTVGTGSPWTDERMVTCERDDSIVVAIGAIRVRDGTLLPIYGKPQICNWLSSEVPKQ